MQLLDLAFAHRFGVIAHTRIEGARRTLHELLLPGIDLVGVNLITLSKISHRGAFPERLQGNLRLQPSVNLPPRLRHHSLLSPKERQLIQSSPWSQKPGPLQYDHPG